MGIGKKSPGSLLPKKSRAFLNSGSDTAKPVSKSLLMMMPADWLENILADRNCRHYVSREKHIKRSQSQFWEEQITK